jgi:ABC-type polar amino acid transport system ATPase subunit
VLLPGSGGRLAHGAERSNWTVKCIFETLVANPVANRVLFMDMTGEIVETADAAKFFNVPEFERAKAFLARILKH